MAEDTDPAVLDSDAGPEAAFALVGNDIRADILRVLGERAHETVPFSELREATDVEADSGQFNYHLQQLVDAFVVHSEDGYRLRPEGLTLYRAIVAGTFTRRSSTDTFDAGFACYFCGGAVEAFYADARITIRCPDCEHRYHFGQAPPSIADGTDGAALLDRVNDFSRHDMLTFARGVCARCATPVDIELLTVEESPFDVYHELDLFAAFNCHNCGAGQYMSVGTALLREPALIAFCHDHDLDVTKTPFWELEFAMTDHCVTVLETDPWRVEFSLTMDEETLTLVIDGEMAVIEQERSATVD